MKYLTTCWLLATLLLASCTRPPSAQPPQSEPIGADALPPDSTLTAQPAQPSTVPVARPRTFLDKVLHRTPAPWVVQPITAHQPINIGNVPKKCKGCTFNVVAGNQTVAGKKATVAAGEGAVASHIEKKAGPAIVASDSSTQNAVLGGGNIQATNGNNNAPQLTAPVQQAADWRAVLAKPAGAVLASVLAVALVGGSIFLIAAYRRSKKLADQV